MLLEELYSKVKKIRLLLFDCDGVLTNGQIIFGSNNMDIKNFSTRDGLGIGLWHKAGYACGVITARYSEALERRARELNFEEIHQKVEDKKAVVKEIIKRRNILNENVAYIGDDINDLCVKSEVGIFFAPFDAHPVVLEIADYQLKTPGGYGAVREAIELILKAQNLYNDIIKTYF